jgi:hypothetical protein
MIGSFWKNWLYLASKYSLWSEISKIFALKGIFASVCIRFASKIRRFVSMRNKRIKPVLFGSKRINIRFIFAYIRFEPNITAHPISNPWTARQSRLGRSPTRRNLQQTSATSLMQLMQWQTPCPGRQDTWRQKTLPKYTKYSATYPLKTK